MKRKIFTVCVAMLVIMISGCSGNLSKQYPDTIKISLENPSSFDREDETVIIPMDRIIKSHPDFNAEAFVVLKGREELASQAADLDADGQLDAIIIQTDLSGNEVASLTVRYTKTGKILRNYAKRTQAELSHKFGGHFENRIYKGGDFKNVDYLKVPPEHTDHSFYIRYEGPGWESDKVGYRFYLDWRNAIDIFGKKRPGMVLQDVGLDGFDSYHEMSDWGMDILKVGESLGIGSLAMWVKGHAQRVAQTDSVICLIADNGPVYSQIRTKYYGWKVGAFKGNVISDLSITAGSRITCHDIEISGNPPNLCTGIVKDKNAEMFVSSYPESEWQYMATWGRQSLADDDLGMAVLFKTQDLILTADDKLSHVVVLQPTQGRLKYYFLAAWSKEPQGIQNQMDFLKYLDESVSRLNADIKVSIQ